MVYLSKMNYRFGRRSNDASSSKKPTWLARWTNPLGLTKKRLRPNEFSLRTVGQWLIIFALAGIVLTATAFAYYSKDLPTPGKLADLKVAQSTQILDRNGKLLYEIHGTQNRTIVTLDKIPKIAQQATLAAEDANFYKEPGFNIQGIIRSAFIDIFSTHSLTNGGSTITQQFVKNALLTSDKSFTRKFKELILSIEMESRFSKDDILTMYLNQIPYGSGAYGIQTASQTFFSKDAKDLDLAQSSVLAAMLNAPTHYSPYGSHKDELIDRQHYILDRMVDLKMVSKEDADNAKAEELTFAEPTQGILAPHFSLYVKELLVDKYGEKSVEEGGLKVTTTLDYDLQQKAEKAIADNEKHYQANGASNAALVAMDPKTGQILAMVGSHDYFDTDHDGNVNVALAERQPGSSFKPLVYATAFKNKYNPATTLWDVPTDFGNYKPQNYDGSFHGPVSMRFALQNSLNIPAVKTLALVGVPAALQTAHDMGITSLNDDPSRYGLSLVLGGGEVRLLDMVNAYSTFANQGITRDSTPILKIEDSTGKVLEQFDDNRGKHQSLDPQVAYEMSNVLSDNNARATVFGTRSPLFFADRPVAAKTGTTNDFRDGWTIGYTPSLAAGVWVGNNDNHSLKTGADGVVVAAPIFHAFVAAALSGKPAEQFTQPAGIKTVTVDKFSNLLPSDGSPETVTDIFTSWQVPKDHDNIHVKVKVNKLTGQLATEFTPPELTEERTYTNLHSEMPNNASWEGPVIAYAQSHNITVSNPPTDTDSMYTETSRPTVSITSPSDNQTVSGSFTIAATVGGTIPLKRVEAYLDGNLINSATAAPYQFTASTGSLPVGSYDIKVIAIDENDAPVSDTVTIVVNADTTPPAEVSGLSATAGSSSATLNWTNPSTSDLNRANVYASTVPGTLGSKVVSNVAVQPSTNTSVVIPSLTPGVTYYFTVKTVDTNSNESHGSAVVSATPHI